MTIERMKERLKIDRKDGIKNEDGKKGEKIKTERNR